MVHFRKCRARSVFGALFALLLVGEVGGCTTIDKASGVPNEATPQPAYPEIGAVPPERQEKTLTDEERAKAEAELKDLATSRQRAVERKLSTGQ